MTRCGTTASGVPSARTSCSALPKATAWPWARTFDDTMAGWSRGGAVGRVQGIAPADPVPEAEHVRGVDAELGYLPRVRRDGHEVLGDRGGIAKLAQHPVARRPGVRQRLEGPEGLRRDDEKRLL